MSTQEKTFRGTPFYYISIAITAIIMFCFHLLPTFGSVTTTGLWVIGIFIGLVWGWSTCDLLVPSIMGLVAFGFSGLYDNVTASFSAGIGNQNTLILLVLFVILGVLQVSGITRWMGIKLISLKIARGKPWVLVFVLFFTSYALQALSGSMAACLLVWTIFYFGIYLHFTSLACLCLEMVGCFGAFHKTRPSDPVRLALLYLCVI